MPLSAPGLSGRLFSLQSLYTMNTVTKQSHENLFSARNDGGQNSASLPKGPPGAQGGQSREPAEDPDILRIRDPAG